MQFVKDFGLEADRHLLRCLFSAVDFSCSPGRSGDATTPGHSRSNSTSSSNSNNNYYSSGPLSLQARLLSTELVGLLTKPQLVGNVCFAVDNPLPQQRVRNFACFFYNLSFRFVRKIFTFMYVSGVPTLHCCSCFSLCSLRVAPNLNVCASVE